LVGKISLKEFKGNSEELLALINALKKENGNT